MSNSQDSGFVAPIDLVRALRVAGISEPMADVRSLADGMLNTVIRIGFGGSHPDVILRIRRFQHSEYGQEFAAERFAYPLLDANSVTYPKLFYVCTDASVAGSIFAIFEYVDGRPFDEVMAGGTGAGSVFRRLLPRLVNSITAIHRVRRDFFGTHTHQSHPAHERRAFFEQLFSREACRLRELGLSFSTAFGKAAAHWLDVLDALPAKLGDPTLVHGDLHGRNLLVGEDCTIYFIDWEASRFRIAPYDLAQMRYVNFRANRASFDLLLRGYAEAAGVHTDLTLLHEAICICQCYWQCRMGLFLLQFPAMETTYFGAAAEHLSDVSKAVERFA